MHPNDGRVVSYFVVQALRGEPLAVYGDGQQTRSFCYVDDLVAGFLKFMDSREGFTGPMNLGNPDEFTILALAELVRELTNSRSAIVRQPATQDDPKQRKPDISLAQAEIGWQPGIALREGLRRTIEYFDADNVKTATSSAPSKARSTR